MTSPSTENSPLTILQVQFKQARRDAVRPGSACLVRRGAGVVDDHSSLLTRAGRGAGHSGLRPSRQMLHALLVRAAKSDSAGVTATEMVVNAMLPAVPGIVGRVVRAARTAGDGVGVRGGVTGGGVSASEDSRDIQAAVIGHLWEQTRCYPLGVGTTSRKPHARDRRSRGVWFNSHWYARAVEVGLPEPREPSISSMKSSMLNKLGRR